MTVVGHLPLTAPHKLQSWAPLKTPLPPPTCPGGLTGLVCLSTAALAGRKEWVQGQPWLQAQGQALT